MTIDQVISLGACIGAFLSATAAFLAVKQSSKHSEASYKPELVLVKTVFEALKNPLIEESTPASWVADYKEKNKEKHFEYFSIPIRNIGLGAAKNINISWSFDIENIVTKINELTQKNHIASYYEYNNGALSLKSKTGGDNCSFWSNQQEERLDFVLPASMDFDPQKLIVPLAYIQLASALVTYSNSSGETKIPELPKLVVSFEFYDIGGKKYKSKFELVLKLVAIVGKGERFTAYLEAKSKT